MNGFCDHPGCKDVAACRPTVIVRAKKKPDGKPIGHDLFFQQYLGEDKYELEYNVQMEFCSYHKDFFQPKRLMDEACWSAIENQTRQNGLAPPCKDTISVRWEEAAGANGLLVEA